MEITISTQGFKDKPKIPGITYDKMNIELNGLEKYIRNGYVLSANFNTDYPITQRNRTLSNFQSIPYVMIDMDDDIDYELEVLVDSLSITPTIAYSTFSHGIKGNRYRLLYFFDKPITSIITYKHIYSFICGDCNLNLKDGCGSNPVQACIGSKEDCEYYYTGEIYNHEDFYKEYLQYQEIIDNNYNISGQKDSILEERKSNIQFTCPVDISEEDKSNLYDRDFLNDYRNKSYKELLDKYKDKYEYLERTPLPFTDANTPIILLPNNYVEIKRYVYKEPRYDSNGKRISYISRVRKLRDGEGRKRKIYTSTLLRKVMKPGISFPHLLYCGLFDLYHYCYNEYDPIDKGQLYNAVMNAAGDSPRESLIERSRPSKKYVANPAYCDKYRVSRQKAIGDYKRLQKEKKYAEIGIFYNSDYTYEENQQVMKEGGLEVSIKDIQRYRSANHLPPLPRKSKKRNLQKEVIDKGAIPTSDPIDTLSNANTDDYIVLEANPIVEEERKRLFAEVIRNATLDIA